MRSLSGRIDFERNPGGSEKLYVHGATVSDLSRFLNRDVPYVWILDHSPHNYCEWWEATVPLTDAETIRASVRLLTYDLQLATNEFLARTHLFDTYGLVLVQADRPMPNTLVLSHVPEAQRDEVLIQNGAFLRIFLPHAVETAMVVCYQPGYLERIIGDDETRA